MKTVSALGCCTLPGRGNNEVLVQPVEHDMLRAAEHNAVECSAVNIAIIMRLRGCKQALHPRGPSGAAGGRGRGASALHLATNNSHKDSLVIVVTLLSHLRR